MNSTATSDGPAQSLLPVKTAATLLGVGQRTVWRMIAEGQLRVVRVRNCTRLHSDDVAKLVTNGTQRRKA